MNQLIEISHIFFLFCSISRQELERLQRPTQQVLLPRLSVAMGRSIGTLSCEDQVVPCLCSAMAWYHPSNASYTAGLLSMFFSIPHGAHVYFCSRSCGESPDLIDKSWEIIYGPYLILGHIIANSVHNCRWRLPWIHPSLPAQTPWRSGHGWDLGVLGSSCGIAAVLRGSFSCQVSCARMSWYIAIV